MRRARAYAGYDQALASHLDLPLPDLALYPRGHLFAIEVRPRELNINPLPLAPRCENDLLLVVNPQRALSKAASFGVKGGASQTVAAEVLRPVRVEHPQGDFVPIVRVNEQSVRPDPKMPVAKYDGETG
ncbi:MAG: hypothetical protein KatS3mg015_1012 [Fimbriimonadales bacterium]|nr:MAG: hypothetical protein KatS3mg015_1012 [Fimbriimonadales bacterium]